MKTLVCCIVKQENLYLRDWIKYYKRLGVDKIVLYDNNDIDGEYPQQVIGDFIEDNFVDYINARGKYRYQLEAYTDCYSQYKSNYDWLGFFDIDEYVEITGKQTINEYLGQDMFSDTYCLPLYWVIYGDNGLLHYDSRPVYDRFLLPNKADVSEPTCFKIFLRGRVNVEIEFTDANSIKWLSFEPAPFKIKNTAGDVLAADMIYEGTSFDGMYLKHYNTLTIEEFLYRRFGRKSYADRASSFNKNVIIKCYVICKNRLRDR